MLSLVHSSEFEVFFLVFSPISKNVSILLFFKSLSYTVRTIANVFFLFFFPDFLETLILKRNCTDAILEKACESSPYLHTVDISSSLLITDKSITALQTLKYLKNLDVFATSITHEGTDILLQLLPSTMNTLGCNSICKLNRFSQLKSLHTRIFSNYIPLNNFQNLNLKLHFCRNVDVSIIIRECVNLKIFKLHSCSYSLNLQQTIRDCPAGLKRLFQFTLDKSSKFPSYPNIDKLIVQYALNFVENIRHIYIESYAIFDEEFFEIFLHNNKLIYLEEMYLYAIYPNILECDVICQIIKQCPNLSILNTRGYALTGVENIQQKLRSEFPGIKININMDSNE
ncbi:hypothetical protein L9F63_001011 [Diploptera punctata]|uniref:Uncharacterized protein n=1 Tax=Diploptera punctata TaxID=6984 RepID=A0AAD8AKM3_DIPPU|nr:hypothetical protein L9F63_001011 [Diploptera punctata]